MNQRFSTEKIDPLLARFFSETTIRALLKNQEASHSLIREFVSLLDKHSLPFAGKTYQDLFEFCYGHLLKNYRNEYVYKNAIANNILLGIHTLNTSFMLQEFRIGTCKADTIVLNGTSNVYEIKTELDSLDRLQNQVNTYLQVFDMVHVITFPGQSQKIEKFVPENVGLMELKQRGNISTIRKAESGKRNISPALLFDCLRKSEYKAILIKHYGSAPDVPNTKEYQACKELFVKMPPEVAHDLAVVQLKKRGDSLLVKDFVQSVPSYFKSLSLQARFSQKETQQLSRLLETELCAA